MNTKYIPRSIAEILLYNPEIKEFHFAITQGLWRYESWGYPVIDNSQGAEAWAWFSGQNLTDNDVDEKWKKLANIFSGILCASLNNIDKTNTIQPKFSLRPLFVGKILLSEMNCSP